MSSLRKHIPLKAQLHAALYQLGFEPHEVELDHDPALALRERCPTTGDTIPAANDPKFLVWRPIADHRQKTFGKGGEKRVTTLGSDIHAIAKTRRLSKEHEEFRRRLLEKPPRQERPKSRWPKRKFNTRKTK